MPPNSATLGLLLLSTACIQSIQAHLPCTQEGKFNIPESCQEYYECRAQRGNMYPIPSTCPQGQLFDDIRTECVPEDLLTSPSQCVKAPEVHAEVTKDTTGIADSNPLNTSSSSEASIFPGIEPTLITVNANTLCENINIIDNYVSLAIGTPLLKDSFDYKNINNVTILEYNTDLKRAKDNTFLWTKGESFDSGIKATLLKTNEYKVEFQRKFDINKAQIQGLANQTTDKKIVERLIEITNLREDIKEAELILKVSSVPGYYEGVIISKTEEIERKLLSIKLSTKEGAALQEMVKFLGFVKDDANEVVSLTKKWQEQLGNFLESLRSDVDAFNKHSTETTGSISALVKEKEQLQQSQIDDVIRKRQLESRKEALNTEVNTLTEENFEISQRIFHLLGVMENKTTTFYNKQHSYCLPKGPISEYVNKFSTAQQIAAACDYVLRKFNIYLDTRAEKAKIKQLRAQSEANRIHASGKLEELEAITNELGKLSGNSSPFTHRMDEIDLELSNLQRHVSDLNGLTEGVYEAISAIHKIQEVGQQEQNTLVALTNNFQSMINKANAVINNADKLNQRTLIDEALSAIYKIHEGGYQVQNTFDALRDNFDALRKNFYNMRDIPKVADNDTDKLNNRIVDEAVLAIYRIIDVAQHVQNAFEALTNDFQNITDKANDAANDADRLNQRTLIDEAMTNIHRNLNTLELPKISNCH